MRSLQYFSIYNKFNGRDERIVAQDYPAHIFDRKIYIFLETFDIVRENRERFYMVILDKLFKNIFICSTSQIAYSIMG